MEEKLNEAIEAAIASGVAPNLVGEALVAQGWPRDKVAPALEKWLLANGKSRLAVGFKEWLKKYYQMARRAVVIVVGLNLVDTAIALLKPWPVKIMADSVFGNIEPWSFLTKYDKVTLLLITSLMTVSLFVIGHLFGAFRDYFLLKIGFNLNRAIKEESLRHILHLPLYHAERLPKGDYVYRQNVVTDSLSQLVLGTTSAIIQSILIMLGVLVIMLVINPGLTLISVVLLPLLFMSIKIVGPKMGIWARKYTENASDISSKINESINNAESIQAFTLEEKSVTNINKLWVNSFLYTKKNMLWGELLDGVNGLLVTVATSSVMLVGGAAALNGELTFGDLLIFMTYMGYLIGPVEQLISQITTRNQKLIDVSRIYEVMTDHAGVEYLRRDSHMPPSVKGTIEFNNVSYAYKDQQVLSNVNFTIPAGQKVGIIGPSGGGKSTILKMLPLFLEPKEGKITIDGFDTQNVSLQELRQKIAWVSQTPQLFNENIIDNLLEGDINREISNEEIEHAVDVSNITEFVVKMPLAFKTPVGEDGGSLSGGQRQRLSIARALIKDAPIICLDEPTAALDVKSENYIRDSLQQMIQGKTVVMVTHRKPLLALMDIIYVLEGGQLNDVRNFGGIDAYLAKLEGIEQQQAVAEISQETQEMAAYNAQLIEQINQMQLQQEQANEQSELQAQQAYQAEQQAQYFEQQQVEQTELQPEQHPGQYINPQNPNETVRVDENGAEEVEIKLH